MAENTITRAQALEIAIAAIKDTNPDAAAALQKMHASITKPRSADPNKAAQMNRRVDAVCKAFADVDAFQNADVRAVMNGVDWIGSKGIVSPQLVTAVLKRGVADGKIVKEIVGSGSSSITFYTVV